MKKLIGLLSCVVMLAAITGCETAGTNVPDNPREVLLYQTESPRPSWTNGDLSWDDDEVSFIAISPRVSTEPMARRRARRDAFEQFAEQLGVLVRNKFQQALVDYGLSSDVVDPTVVTREFREQLTSNVAQNLRFVQWYGEKWQTPSGIGWEYFALARVGRPMVEESFSTAVAEAQRANEQRWRDESAQIAAEQVDRANEMWDELSGTGLFD